MISRPIDADTLEEYYKKLYDLQSGAHQPEYMLVHNEIRSRLKSCNSYTEFGINQGATLAAAVLQNPPAVRAYDIKLDWYNKAHSLFEQYASNHSIDYRVFESSTLDCDIVPTDLLYIDTQHKYEHLRAELVRHAKKVRKFIICHDTTLKPGLKRAIDEFVRAQPVWSIAYHCSTNVGFTTIARKTK